MYVPVHDANNDCRDLAPLRGQRRKNDLIEFGLGQGRWQTNLIPAQLAVELRVVIIIYYGRLRVGMLFVDFCQDALVQGGNDLVEQLAELQSIRLARPATARSAPRNAWSTSVNLFTIPIACSRFMMPHPPHGSGAL